jgi:hypothetical protein
MKLEKVLEISLKLLKLIKAIVEIINSIINK